MIKLLYLMVGLSLKQTIDELKAVSVEKVSALEKQYASVKEYRAVPSIQKGSKEAYETINRANHQQSVQPELAQIRKKIRFYKRIPLLSYSVLTVALLVLIGWLESLGIE